MSEELKRDIAIAANNTIRLAVFAVLAVIFDNLWILGLTMFVWLGRDNKNEKN